MSWETVDLTGVSTEMETLPENVPFTFQLLAGAKYGQWDPNKIELGAKVVSGEYAGRVVYFSYGNPEKSPSMIQALKRLEVALVKDGAPAIEADEDKVAYLNNPDVVGKHFIAPLKHRTYEKDGENITKADVSVFKVRAIK